MNVDRLVEIERNDLPEATAAIHAAKKRAQELATEAETIRRQLVKRIPKEPGIVLWSTSDPRVMVEGRHREQSITVLDVTRED